MSVGAGVDDEGEGLPIRRRRWPWMLLALLALVVLALAGLWLARKPLATRYADRFLAAKHVPARYRIVDLGLGRQRLVDVVIGDPADPDLVADWLEARTGVGLSGPYLTGVRAGHLRLRARWVDGRLSFGSIDRLLPKGDAGKPFALPALSLDVADARARIETPLGVVGAKLGGSGRLDGGFAGRLALTAARLGGGCGADAPRAVLAVRTRAEAVRFEGSAELAGAACDGVAIGYANFNGDGEATLGRAIGWTLNTDLVAQAVRHPAVRAQQVAGRVQLRGGQRIGGEIGLTAQTVQGQGQQQGLAAARATLDGSVLYDPAARARFAYQGRLGWTGGAWRAGNWRAAAVADGTPVGPLLRRATRAMGAAARRFDGTARVYLATGPAGSAVEVQGAEMAAATGASLVFDHGQAAWAPGQGLRVDGDARLRGGGLPDVAVAFDPAGPNAFRGVARVQSYAADGARLALAPVRFAVAGGQGSIATRATLTGPLGDGHVEALTMPLVARWRGDTLALGPDCAPVGWTRIAVAGLVLARGGVRLCPTGGALVQVANGRVGGGASLGATRLSGRLGDTPLTLAAQGAQLRLGDRGFAVQGVAARLGRPERVTRLDIATLTGRATPAGLAGRFAGAGGQIGAVPLLLSDAAGDWRVQGGALALTGALTVGDAQTARPRFRPLPARDVALTLAGGRIEAAGRLVAPTDGRRVADLRLTHDLSRGAGAARFTVPGLVFDKALQPDQLTPLTFGVIADVRGTVTGDGAIDWSPAGVTSTGRFRTADTALAAAFGPVEGIAGTIEFTDLLALRSAPGQRFTVRSVNPGIAVTDGTVVFQTLPDTRVQVEGGRWPFAGGTLTLAPTLLDFGQAVPKRLVFRVEGMQADQFLQQFDFRNLQATGTFDGELPMVFDQSGGRIENGRLQVRRGANGGGGTLAYLGPISQKNLGVWGNLAFQALRSLRYRNLTIAMDGPLAGEMVTDVRFAGISQGEGAERSGVAGFLVRRLQRLPFVFNIRIRAPFRGLIDTTTSFYDPEQLVRRNLPQLLDRQRQPIQPPASETVP